MFVGLPLLPRLRRVPVVEFYVEQNIFQELYLLTDVPFLIVL